MSSPRPYLDISSTHNARQLTPPQIDTLVFHPFGRLAVEIRLQIWSEALPPPRALEIELQSGLIGVLPSSHQPSALLSVNRESRTLFLQSYRKFDLLVPTSNENRQKTTAKAVWHFNPTIDTIYISSVPSHPSRANYCLHQLAETSFNELQFLAVNHSYLHEILTLRNLRRFPAMKELRLITADHLWDEREDGGN
jgi:2EXR family